MANSVNYTYDDFLKTVDSYGLSLDQFSDADLKLAQSDPNAGVGIAGAKRDYLAADTDDARALANENANSIRKSYGNYNGGGDGTSYTPYGDTPSSFESAAAPSFSGSYSGDVSDSYSALKNYSSDYTDKINNQVSALENYGEFSYDPSTDPLYSSYKKQYTREGQRSMQDTLGTVAASTGGVPSSYAVSAASQANDYYMTQLGDKLPELYNLSYNKWSDEYNRQKDLLDVYNNQDNTAYNRALNSYDAARELDDTEYNRYRDSYGDWESNRNFDYNQLLDQIDYNTNAEQTAYDRSRDKISDERYADETAYNRSRDDISDARYNDETAYSREQDAEQQQYDRAVAAAEYGDFTQLADYYGVNTASAEKIYNMQIQQSQANISNTEADTAYTKASTANVGASTALSSQKYADEQNESSAVLAALDKYYSGEELTSSEKALLAKAGYYGNDDSTIDVNALYSKYANGTATVAEANILRDAGVLSDDDFDVYAKSLYGSENGEYANEATSEYPTNISQIDRNSLRAFEAEAGGQVDYDTLVRMSQNGQVIFSKRSDGNYDVKYIDIG